MNCNKLGDLFNVAPSLGQNSNLFNSLVHDQTNDFPVSLDCTLCLVLISKVSMLTL